MFESTISDKKRISMCLFFMLLQFRVIYLRKLWCSFALFARISYESAGPGLTSMSPH